MKTVIIKISDNDYEDLFQRVSEEEQGKPQIGTLLVGVQKVITREEAERGLYVQGFKRHCSGFGITTS